MLHIGCHLSSSKGFLAMGRQALELEADTFQFFTRNPRGSRAKDLDVADVEALKALLAEHAFAPIVAHAPYTLNLCGREEANRVFARETMADDLRRLDYLPGQYYNFHPGSHVGQGTEAGITHIAQGLNAILRPDQGTTVLLETMAGKGSEVGCRFEELREILDRIDLPEKMGVCLDTCHVFDGGYDIVGDLDGVLMEFDRVIGLDRLKAIHLNDSKNPLGSHKDRHECIGEGCIGLEALSRVVRHPALRDLPFCLETPNELPGYAREIALLRRQAEA
jgi:deoxyribonuclease-4